MKFILLLTICVSSALALPHTFADAEPCISENCKREDGCVCAGTGSPLSLDKTPQFVTITMDDSLRADIYDNYVATLLFDRENPDGKPISSTFLVNHQYTDYEKINTLYNKGFEIGVNSISKNVTEYWTKATVEQLIDEMKGQREITAKFANIPIDDIKGVRTPHFQLAGDKTFEAYTAAGLSQDNSFTALSDNPLFPFTLHYKINQQCLIGECPTQSFPNIWMLPIVNFVGANGQQCNVLISCERNGTAAIIRDWLIEQFERHYIHSRAPINLLVTSSWFEYEPNSFEGFSLFLDYLKGKKDTYLVSHSEVIRWAKNPVETDKYQTNHSTKNQSCAEKTCALPFGEFEIRYMRTCAEVCPAVYPWLGNHYGEEK